MWRLRLWTAAVTVPSAPARLAPRRRRLRRRRPLQLCQPGGWHLLWKGLIAAQPVLRRCHRRRCRWHLAAAARAPPLHPSSRRRPRGRRPRQQLELLQCTLQHELKPGLPPSAARAAAAAALGGAPSAFLAQQQPVQLSPRLCQAGQQHCELIHWASFRQPAEFIDAQLAAALGRRETDGAALPIAAADQDSLIKECGSCWLVCWQRRHGLL